MEFFSKFYPITRILQFGRSEVNFRRSPLEKINDNEREKRSKEGNDRVRRRSSEMKERAKGGRFSLERDKK